MTDEFDRLVSAAHLSASGWSLDSHHQSNPFESYFFYVRDFRTDHVQLFSVKQTTFHALRESPSFREICRGIAALMLRAHADKLTRKELDALCGCLIGYIKETQVYRAWLQEALPDQRLHALLHIYGAPRDVLLRPVIAKAEQPILPVDEVQALSERVLALDRQHHPEWFARG